ncbi:unnamed protein product [Orchesella dallaii]|uniref:Uncharacterized protein n=1 Tax=Orchesella dallaii TaxID=48710 RepID=A0ABP1QKC9_9HEXA
MRSCLRHNNTHYVPCLFSPQNLPVQKKRSDWLLHSLRLKKCILCVYIKVTRERSLENLYFYMSSQPAVPPPSSNNWASIQITKPSYDGDTGCSCKTISILNINRLQECI